MLHKGWIRQTLTVVFALAVVAGAGYVFRAIPAGSAALRVRTANSAEVTAVFLGDSYTVGAHSTDHDKSFTARIASAQGWTEINLGLGGTGYISFSRGGCGSDYCPSYTEMIPEAAAEDPDIVVVSGGANEITRINSEWAAGVSAFYVKLRAAMPRAKIVATSPIWRSHPLPPALETMRTVVRKAVTDVGGVYVDLGDPLLGDSSLLAQDKIHPNDAGHAAIARAFAAAYRS